MTSSLFITAKNGHDRISKRDDLLFDPSSRDGLVRVHVSSRYHYQKIEGFGGAFTESSAINFAKLDFESQQKFLRSYFDREDGIGYSLCRTHINSCDFSESNYSYDDVDGDVDLMHFSIDRDRKQLIPMILSAQKVAGDKFKLLSSPWSPPGWMKNTGRMNYGGKLHPKYFKTWANYLIRYIKDYQKEGISIWGLTIQNEPEERLLWESCLYSPREEADFIANFLGPSLEREGLEDVKIICCDENRCQILDRAKKIYSNPSAYNYIWGAGFHWYCHSGYDDLSKLHQLYPDKKLLFTEGSITGGTFHGEWEVGERYAESMINDINNWAVGWIDWNLLLDQDGGPNHVGNFCSAPVIFDLSKKDLMYQISYYYIGHFSKFIMPGAVRIHSQHTTNKIMLTAFENPNGQIVIVILNRKKMDVSLNLEVNEKKMGVEVMARSIVTVCVDAN